MEPIECLFHTFGTDMADDVFKYMKNPYKAEYDCVMRELKNAGKLFENIIYQSINEYCETIMDVLSARVLDDDEITIENETIRADVYESRNGNITHHLETGLHPLFAKYYLNFVEAFADLTNEIYERYQKYNNILKKLD